MQKMIKLIIPAILLLIMIGGCAIRGQILDGDGMELTEEEAERYAKQRAERSEDSTDGDNMNAEHNMDPVAIPVVYINGEYYGSEFENNSSAEALIEKIKKKPLKIVMQDNDGYGKVGDLSWRLPDDDEEITAQPGDVILCQGKQIIVCCDENTCISTKIAHLCIDDPEAFRKALGAGNITVEITVEFTE